MSIAIQITVSGAPELKEALRKKNVKVNSNLIDEIERGCVLIYNSTLEIAPVKYGPLKANVAWEIEASRNPVVDAEMSIIGRVGVRDIIDYAEPLELRGIAGTAHPKKPGKKIPFLLPSFNKHITAINDNIAKAIVDGLND